MDELNNIIESLLFVTDEPLTVDRIRKVVKTAEPKTIREALRVLSEAYEARRGGFYLAEVAGGFQLRSRPEYKEYIKDMLQPSAPRLSKAALETLAIIAYKQPIIRADLEHLRGVDSGGVLRMLLKRKLIRVLGRKEIPGRPLIYATTKRFLEMFDLKDLKDLPTPKEIEELGSEASDELAAAFEALELPPDGPAAPQEEPGLFDPPRQPDAPENGLPPKGQENGAPLPAAAPARSAGAQTDGGRDDTGGPEPSQPADIHENSDFPDEPSDAAGGENQADSEEDTDRRDRL
jgi:segregation and condensation protein B